MFSFKGDLYQAPAIQARVLQFNNNGSLPPVATVENKGTANSVAIVYQESVDGATWTDIQGTTRSVSPQQSDVQVVVATKRLIALAAQGNESILVTIHRTINGTVSDLGPA